MTGPVEGRIRRWLASRRIVWWAALLAAGLATPSLWAGLQTEDFLHREVSQEAGAGANLFASVSNRMQVYALQDAGQLPWITSGDWKLAFSRPLTSLTHHLDYGAWPQTPPLMHAHSLLWLAVLVGVVATVYRRIFGVAWLAGLAAVLYAIDDGHGPAVGWLANRSATIAPVFGALALWAHDRWRRDGWRHGALLSSGLLWLGLQGGELAVGAMGYLVAYAIFLDRGSAGRRVTSLVPACLAVGLWAAAYVLMGFGAHGSAAYVDPVEDPSRFARAAAGRLPLLLHGLLGAPSTDFVVVLEDWHSVFLGLGLAHFALAALGLAPILRRDRKARFWATGMVLSALPACTAMPADRLLFLPGIGGMGLVAATVGSLWGGALPTGRLARLATGALAAVWTVIHGPAAAILLPYRSLGVKKHDEWVQAATTAAFAGVDAAKQQLVIVNAPDFYTGTLLAGVQRARGGPVPEHVRVLYGGDEPATVTRTDDRTVVVRPALGFLVPRMNEVYRDEQHPMHLGEGLQLTSLQIVVREVDERGAPMAASFRFRWPLESNRLAWKVWDGRTYVPFHPPGLGRTVTVPGIELEIF